MSDESYINQLTLSYLVNQQQYHKYIESKTLKSINKKDAKFYRKRIMNLTRDLLLTTDLSTNLLPDVNHAFDHYVKSCIRYFKILDNNDIIQEDYKSIVENELLNQLYNESEKGMPFENIKTQEEANQLMMRTVQIKKSTLDPFIKIKTTKKPEELFFPKQKEINLKDPQLKNKGIVKKKNITNKYDENKISKNETDEKKENII